jgi:succinate dehydrogenase / fumarate reductase membrane anchor subunit
MVKNVTSLTRSGLRDWLFQRVSAIIIGIYVIFLATFILCHPHMEYATWQSLFAHTLMRIATVIVLIAILIHAYIGMWTISTDYLTKSTPIRLLFQVVVWVALIAFLIWGIMILWGL